jgi:predicted nucleic acid-binding protein
VAAQPDLIITGDKDLLVLGTHAGVPIVSAAEALARIAPRL